MYFAYMGPVYYVHVCACSRCMMNANITIVLFDIKHLVMRLIDQ